MPGAENLKAELGYGIGGVSAGVLPAIRAPPAPSVLPKARLAPAPYFVHLSPKTELTAGAVLRRSNFIMS